MLDGSITVELTGQDAYAVEAAVNNGKGAVYEVQLSVFGCTCTCPDAEYRQNKTGAGCLHAIAACFALSHATRQGGVA